MTAVSSFSALSTCSTVPLAMSTRASKDCVALPISVVLVNTLMLIAPIEPELRLKPFLKCSLVNTLLASIRISLPSNELLLPMSTTA